MPLLALALICWIAAGCLGAGYLAEMTRTIRETAISADIAENEVRDLRSGAIRESHDVWNEFKREKARLDVVSTVADYAKDQARLANKLSEGNAKTLQDHLDWVWAERAKREKAALGASRPRRKAHDREQ